MRADLASDARGEIPRGAVGAFDNAGEVLFGYPESAGYWLQWSSGRQDVPSAAGDRVIEWLADIQRTRGRWPPRTARAGMTEDTASYLFDHAILWHGLRCWANGRGSDNAHRLASAVLAATQRFAVNGELVAGWGPMPARWSARVGPFLLKACARLRHATGPISAACARAMPALLEQALRSPHTEAHPQLYGIEGMIVMDHVADARRAFGDLVGRFGGVAGIRESTLGGPRRSDVLSQLLRVALMLGLASREESSWAALVEELIGRIDENGRLAFSDTDVSRPTWAALFCEQALTLWQGEPLAAAELV